MSFINKWFRKTPEEITDKNIQDFIDRQIEENLNLEYKGIDIFFNFNKIAEIISAFANSYGGLLILGISEKKVGKEKIFPDKITWGEPSLKKEQLEDNIIHKIYPNIEGLFIQPIRIFDGSGKVLFLIDIPKSIEKPHMCNNRFYRRLNFENSSMDYNAVKSMFLENQIYREKWIDNVIGPIFNDIIYIMNNISDISSGYSEIFYKIKNKFQFMFIQMNEEGLLEYLEDFYDELAERYKIFDDIYTYTDNLIKNIIIKKYNFLNVENTYIRLSVEGKCIHGNLNHLPIYGNLTNSLLLKIHPLEEIMKNPNIKLINNMKFYIIIENNSKKELSKEDFDLLWSEIETIIRKDELYQYIWESTNKLSSKCEVIYDELNKLI